MQRHLIHILPLLALAGQPAGARAGEPVDESALRYYAATGQAERAARESRRLQAAHPEWTPPGDLRAEEPGRADEEPLWALLSAGKVESLDREIRLRKLREPGWTPSPRLVGERDRKVRRTDLLAAVAAGDWARAGRACADLSVDPRDPELAWAMAETFARTRQEQAASAALRRVLTENRDPLVRVATARKALALLPIEQAEPLVRLVGAVPESAMKSFGLDLTRARMAAFLQGRARAPAAEDEVATLAASVRNSNDAPGAELLGWYALRLGHDQEAHDWFKAALAAGGQAMNTHGLAHALLRLGRRREAEDTAYAWRDALDQNMVLYTDIVEEDLTALRESWMEPERLSRFSQVVLATQSGEGAQALAWYAFRLCQNQVALQWFERAVAWFPKETTILGYAETQRRLNHPAELREMANRYDGLFPTVVAAAMGISRQAEPEGCGKPSSRTVDTTASLGRPRRVEAAHGPVLVPAPFVRPVADGRRNAIPAAPRRPAFLAAVWMENPKRADDAGVVTLGGRGKDARGKHRPGRDASPLEARRVPGVTAMPYEASGFGLLAGYDGTTRPAPVPIGDMPAPRGSLWAEQMAKAAAKPRLAEAPPPAPDMRSPVQAQGSRSVRLIHGADSGAAPGVPFARTGPVPSPR